MAVSETVTAEGIRIFRVRGKLMSNSLEELSTALNAVDERALVVVNLKGAQMADSVALGYLLRRHGLLYQGGGGLALCCLHPSVLKLLASAGLHKHFSLHDREEDAVAALKASYTGPLPTPKKRGRKPKEKNSGERLAE